MALTHSLGLAAVIALAAPARGGAGVAVLSKAIDGAQRALEGKTCGFKAEAVGCALKVTTSCALPTMTYSYSNSIPLARLDLERSGRRTNAGGFAGSHGVELAVAGADIETLTDDGALSKTKKVVLAFGSDAESAGRADAAFGALKAARAECTGKP